MEDKNIELENINNLSLIREYVRKAIEEMASDPELLEKALKSAPESSITKGF